MKKFLAIALIAASFAACNNSSDKPDAAATEAKRIADSTRVADSLKNVSDAAIPTAADLELKRIQDSTRVADSIKNAGH
jgi:hypothetical protein